MLTQEQMSKLQEQPFDPETMGGSVKRQITNPLLVKERSNINFDRQEAFEALYSPATRYEFDRIDALCKKHPEIVSGIEYYEMTREEKMKVWWERLRVIMADPDHRELITGNSYTKSKYYAWYFGFIGTNPMTLHMQMFTKSIG